MPYESGAIIRAAIYRETEKLTVFVRREFTEIRVRLNDLDLDLLHGAAVHFSLVDADDHPGGAHDPDVFAWIEVLASPFLYQMAEVVHELGTVE